jgi:hypothetical protein
MQGGEQSVSSSHSVGLSCLGGPVVRESTDIRGLLPKAATAGLASISLLAAVAQLVTSGWGKALLIGIAVITLEVLIVRMSQLFFTRPLTAMLLQYQTALRRIANPPPITLLEESLELVVTIGARSGEDRLIQRRETTAQPSLGYRMIKPVVARRPRVTSYAQLSPTVRSLRDDVQVSDLALSEDTGGVELLVLFAPPIRETSSWTIECSPPGLFDPLRSNGWDTLAWTPRIAREHTYPERLVKFAVQFIFPSSAAGITVQEDGNRGTQEVDSLRTGQRRVVWVDNTPSSEPYELSSVRPFEIPSLRHYFRLRLLLASACRPFESSATGVV